MPESQKGDSACHLSDIAITNIPQTPDGSKTIEQIRWNYLRAIFALCILVLLAVMAATTIMFCLTKSPLSFSLLSLLAPLFRLRHRVENYLFPISHEDLLLEMSRQTKQDEGASRVTWLSHLMRKLQ